MCRAVLTDMDVVNDPLASTMLHAPQRLFVCLLRQAPFATLARNPSFTFLAARTLFFDNEVNAALDDGVRQVVIIGAGYDSRAWRLAREGVTFYEVDQPATQRDKRGRAPRGGPKYVAADVEIDRLNERLPAAGFDPSARAIFVVEGLTMYLPEAVVRTVLGDLVQLSPAGSRVAVNFTVRGGGSVSPVSRAVAWATRATWRLRGEPTYGWVQPERLPDLLAATDWSVREILPAPELAARYLTKSELPLNGLNAGAICVAADRTTCA
jgi:methyltransferase (TIGR00027 family)